MWECRKCRERHEDTFEICWNCGTAIDGTEDPAFRRAEDDRSDAVLADLVEAPVSPEPPVRHRRCPKCQSIDVIHGVRILVRGDGNAPHDLQVEVDENPEARLFKGRHRGTLTTSICGACGYTELYVANARELLTTYRKAGDAQPRQPQDHA